MKVGNRQSCYVQQNVREKLHCCAANKISRYSYLTAFIEECQKFTKNAKIYKKNSVIIVCSMIVKTCCFGVFQVIFTIVSLYVAKTLRLVSFADFDSTLPRKVSNLVPFEVSTNDNIFTRTDFGWY